MSIIYEVKVLAHSKNGVGICSTNNMRRLYGVVLLFRRSECVVRVGGVFGNDVVDGTEMGNSFWATLHNDLFVIFRRI